jgi:hypothetical protein
MANPPPMDAETRIALGKLADIVEPAPVSWMPQTWGWAALAGILAVLLAWAIWCWYRRRQANRYRAEALVELARLQVQIVDREKRALALITMSALLKRVALVAWPRAQVAALSTSAWVAFLREHAGRAVFPEFAERMLDDIEYRPGQALQAVTQDQAQEFAQAVRGWVEKHRVSA